MNASAAPPQAVHATALMTGDEARSYAKELAESTMVSPYFRGSVPNMLYAIELGKNYGLQPTSVLQHIHVFESVAKDKNGREQTVLKAGLSAALMVYLARSAGHIVNTTANASFAKTTIVRGDSIFGKMLKGEVDAGELKHYSDILAALKEMGVDPKATAFTESTWNLEKAITAGLLNASGQGKGNWAKYPHSMLAARSKTDGIKLACEEVLIQLSDVAANIGEFATVDGRSIDVNWRYTADELGEDITDDGEVIKGSMVQDKAPFQRRSTATVSAPKTAPEPVVQRQQAPAPAPAAEVSPEEEKVRPFVEGADPEAVANYVKSPPGTEDADEKKRRIDMVLGMLVDRCEASRIVAVIEAICELTGIGPQDKVNLIMVIHKRSEKLGRLDSPVVFQPPGSDTPTHGDLAKAIVALVRPLMAAR